MAHGLEVAVEQAGWYRDVVEQSPDGIWVVALDGTTRYTNAAMAALYGADREQMASVSMYDSLDDLGQAQLAEHLRQVQQGLVNEAEVEVRLVRADGGSTWCLVRESVLREDDGTISGVVMTFTDYSSRRQVVDALRTSRRHLAEAQRIAKVGSWEWDLTDDSINGSLEVDALFGAQSVDEPWSYDRFLDRVHPDERHIVEEAVEDALAGKDAFDVTVRVQARGEWLWTRGRGVVHREPDARLWVSGTLQDVTEAKQTELALEDQVTQNTLLQTVASAANAAGSLDELLGQARSLVLLHDDWSRARAFRVHDGSLHPIYLEPAEEQADLETPEVSRAERALAVRALAVHAPVWDEKRLTIAFPVMLEGEPLAVVTITSEPPLVRHAMIQQMVELVADQMARVAWRERVADELARTRDEAMEASRVKSEFLATMSHEIRTPLNGVIGLNDLLLRTSLDPDQQRLATGVQVASRSLLAVINDILDFSKIEAGKLELEVLDFDVRQVFEQAAGVLGEAARTQGIELVVSCAPDVPRTLAGDPTRLTQVVTNLVSNAVKFTSEGEVVVRATAEPHPDGGATLFVTVTDTGSGVPADKVGTLFDPFTQADASTTRTHGGTGLGLAICQEIVHAMDGDIGYEPNPAGGSRFGFTVRLGAPEGELDDDVDERAREQLGGLRALVVDDHENNRLILVEQLAWWGVDADAVESADAAVAALENARLAGTPYAVGLLDMAMPGRDGLELARELRTVPAYRDLPLLMLTSMTHIGTAQAREAGLDDLLVKPVLSGVLRSTLVRLLGRDDSPVARPRAERPGEGYRVLVVEDNPVNQMVAAGLLEALGYAHRTVDDGGAAVEAALAERWDAILMDVQMPVLDGYQATQRIRASEQGHRTPVIAMTAAAIEGERDRCLAAGMDDYLTKPVDPAALAATLARWIGLEQQAPPAAVEPAAPAPGPGGGDSVGDLIGLDVERLDMLRDLDPGSTAYLDRAIGNFTTNCSTGMEAMRQAITAGDAAALRQASHKLAGGALNLGVTYAGEALRAIETISDAGTVDGAAALLPTAEEALSRGRAALAAYQASYRP